VKYVLFVYQLGEHAHHLTSVMTDMNMEYTKAGTKGLVYNPYVGKL
jgi:hypothetical protein